jgi:hypothetical protein
MIVPYKRQNTHLRLKSLEYGSDYAGMGHVSRAHVHKCTISNLGLKTDVSRQQKTDSSAALWSKSYLSGYHHRIRGPYAPRNPSTLDTSQVKP